MKNLPLVLTLALAAVSVSAHADWPTLDQRVKNPWIFSLGSFTEGRELGTSIAPSRGIDQNWCNGESSFNPDLSFLQAFGAELGIGFQAAFHPVDLRISERYQTFGWTNNFSLGSPHSILGIDALFRFNSVYYGPGIGLGYRSTANGFTFQGAPQQVLSAVVGCDVSRSAFAEARLQTASSEQFRAASVSVGLRF